MKKSNEILILKTDRYALVGYNNKIGIDFISAENFPHWIKSADESHPNDIRLLSKRYARFILEVEHA